MVSLVAALTVFATIDEAAISGLNHAAAICNPRYECGGVVRAVPGGFEASGLLTSKRPFGVDLGECASKEKLSSLMRLPREPQMLRPVERPALQVIGNELIEKQEVHCSSRSRRGTARILRLGHAWPRL